MMDLKERRGQKSITEMRYKLLLCHFGSAFVLHILITRQIKSLSYGGRNKIEIFRLMRSKIKKINHNIKEIHARPL